MAHITASIEEVKLDASIVEESIDVEFNGVKIPYFGQMYNQTSQTVNISTQGVYVPMAINGTFDTTNSQGTSAPTTATFGIKNTSGKTLRFMVIATADVNIGNNKSAGWRLGINGVDLPETTCSATTGTSNFAKVMTQWMINLNHNDELTCHLANLTNANNITVVRSKVVAFTV